MIAERGYAVTDAEIKSFVIGMLNEIASTQAKILITAKNTQQTQERIRNSLTRLENYTNHVEKDVQDGVKKLWVIEAAVKAGACPAGE